MMWVRQVVHVMDKDLRRHAPLVLGLVGLGIAAIVVPVVAAGQVHSTWVPFATYAAILILALIVQADSPVRPSAVWRMQPLDPSAVFAAKLTYAAIFAMVLIVVEPLGLPIASRALTRPWSNVWTMAAVLAIAACTADLAGLVVAGVCIYLSIFIASMAVAGFDMTRPPLPPSLGLAIALTIPLVVAFLAYRTPSTRTGRLVMISLVGVSWYAYVASDYLSRLSDGASR